MRSSSAWVCLLFFCLVLSPSVARAEGLSREQGDAILDELRQIRNLLERQPRRPGFALPAPAAQGPAPQENAILRLGPDYSLGRVDAPVAIVEFTDYQCPACDGFRTGTIPRLKKDFVDTGKVRFVVRDLPLSVHPDALKAAQAGRCAGDQGKFWEMHNLLSANSRALGTDAYTRFARELSLDPQAFQACIDGDMHLAEIRASAQGAAAIGIRSTPSFVVGTVKGDILDGVVITGAPPYAVLEKAITDLLTANPAERGAN